MLEKAIEASKDRLAECQASTQFSGKHHDVDSNYRSTGGKAVLEEFIHLKTKSDDSLDGQAVEESRAFKYVKDEKQKWMGVSEPWSSQLEAEDDGQQIPTAVEKENVPQESLPPDQEQAFSCSPNLFLHSKQRVGGAFLPFSRDRQAVLQSPGSGPVSLPELALTSRDHEVIPLLRSEESGSVHSSARGRLRDETEHQGKETLVRTNATGSTGAANNSGNAVSQSQRKARRCWSPELHRRFVDALQQLGGSQVATPKQIRELMKVDGLTNDEVKSHLQKYRLHTRRPSPPPLPASPHAPQLVVLGGIWVPPEFAAHAAVAAQQRQTLYNCEQRPHLCPPSIAQDFYSQLNSSAKVQLHSSLYYNQQHAMGVQSQSSPQGPLHFVGQFSSGARISADAGKEENVEEDGKSETSTWEGGEQEERVHEAEDDDTDVENMKVGGETS